MLSETVWSLMKSVVLIFILLNPFLMAIYLMSLIKAMPLKQFSFIIFRASLISYVVFSFFALFGDFVFEHILQVHFASFLIFGGIVFLIIGLRFIFQGPEAVELLRGKPECVSGAIAMPFMIGPGTINACILIGSENSSFISMGSIFASLLLVALSIIFIKALHDYISKRNEALVERYIDLVGRISSLIIGALAIDMIVNGIAKWLKVIINELNISALLFTLQFTC